MDSSPALVVLEVSNLLVPILPFLALLWKQNFGQLPRVEWSKYFRPRGQGLQTGQTHPPQWNQSHPGFQPSQGIPLTQGTQQIPPGQVGNSQHYLCMSQQSGHTAQNQSWGHGTPVAPRPQVQGIGLGGMVQSFPPTPPTWTSSQFPGHPRLPQYGPGTPSSQRPTQVSPPSRSTSGTPLTPGKTQMGRIPNIPMGQYWKPDEEHYEHYDIQKLNGLTLPRTIRASSWTQLKDIEGCDPLTVPLSKLLYQGSENYWLRKLATGREVYVAAMGEVSQVVFVSEILSQLRSRGIDLDKLAQHKALQDGHALEKKEAIQSLAKLVGDQLQRWSPSIQADTSSHHKIAELEARIAALQASQTNLKLQLPVTKLKHKPQHQKLQTSHLEYHHLLKLPSKDKDLQHLTQLSCWSALAVTINGWKTT